VQRGRDDSCEVDPLRRVARRSLRTEQRSGERSITTITACARSAHPVNKGTFPEMDARARRQVLLGVWENLGRTAAEMPHVGALKRTAAGPGWECADDTVLRALRVRGGPAIFYSGHLANWEIGLSVAASFGLTVSWFYRAAGGCSDSGHAAGGHGDRSANVRQGQCQRTQSDGASAGWRAAGYARGSEAERRPCGALSSAGRL
jgi:hypothetical protein